MTAFDKRSRNAPSKLRQMGLAIGRRGTPLTEMFPSLAPAFGKTADGARPPAPFTPAEMETPWRGAVTPVSARSPAQNVHPQSTYGAAASFAPSGARHAARPVPADPWRQRGAVTPDDRMRRTLQSIATGHPMPISRDRAAAYAASAAAFGASGKERVPDRDGKPYDAADPEHHWYEYETPIGEFSKQLVEAAFQSLLRHAAPGQSSIARDGNLVEAITPLGSLGFIEQAVDPATLAVINHTRKDHSLYPGSVRRSIIVKDGKVWVRTVGEGNGQLPLVNRLFAPLVWESVDGLIWEDVMRAKEHAAFRRLYPELLDRHGGPGLAPYAPSLLRDR